MFGTIVGIRGKFLKNLILVPRLPEQNTLRYLNLPSNFAPLWLISEGLILLKFVKNYYSVFHCDFYFKMLEYFYNFGCNKKLKFDIF